jgi:REP element-mobilizing transposase RayT
MPRKIRVEYGGAIYHVMSRGDRRQDICLDDVDRQDYLKTLAEAGQKTGFQVHAYCLMRNHFHLVIETPNANLVAGMAWLLSTCTMRLNHRHKLFGHVFSGRYKALLVAGDGSGYLRTVCDYVHLNPVRAGLVAAGDRLPAYPRSSLGWYLAAPEHRPHWLRADRLLGEHGIGQDTAAGRREFEVRMEARRAEAADEKALRPLRRGWCLGGESFKQQMLERMEGRTGAHHSGALRQEGAEARAGRIIAEELGRLGWQASDLADRRKNDPGKLALAARLRRETTLPLKWITARVRLGTSKRANPKLHRWLRSHPESTPAASEIDKIYEIKKTN